MPHPFFFNRPRQVGGDVACLKREELGINFRVAAVLPAGDRFQASVFGGPSLFRIKQGIVTDIVYDQSYPYDEARFVRAETTEADGSRLGFNVGADLGYFFTRQLGVGGIVQFAGADVDVASANGDTQTVKVGGLQTGAGLRIRF